MVCFVQKRVSRTLHMWHHLLAGRPPFVCIAGEQGVDLFGRVLYEAMGSNEYIGLLELLKLVWYVLAMMTLFLVRSPG